MNVTCPGCETVYRVDPAKVPPDGVDARCAECGEIFPVESAAEEAVAAGERPAPGVGEETVEPAPPEAPAVTEPTPGVPEEGGAEPGVVTPAEEEETLPATGEDEAPSTAETPEAPPPEPEEAAADLAPPGEETSPPPPAGAGAPEAGPGEAPGEPEAEEGLAFGGPVSPEAPAPGAGPAAPEEPPVEEAEPTGPEAEEAEEETGEAEAVEEPAERAPSPFGRQDPDAKARRLARALVSDMVVYNPERRREALEEGTLRQEFREEIRKSWEEYVAQVGEERAKSTPYFREALNEILAEGEELF